MMLAYQYKLTGVVKVDTVVLVPSLGIKAVLDDWGGKGRVGEKSKCKDTYSQR